MIRKFAGQTKERFHHVNALHSFPVLLKIRLSQWLHKHVEMGERIAELAINRAQKRLKSSKKIVRKKISGGPALPASWLIVQCKISVSLSYFWSKVIQRAVLPNRHVIVSFRP